MKWLGKAGAVLFVVAALGACGSDGAGKASGPFADAVEECKADEAFAVVGDGGHSLSLDTEGMESSGLAFDKFDCILRQLDATDAVMSKIGDTRAMDGRQEASWGDSSASWSYHPDDGVSMVIEEA